MPRRERLNSEAHRFAAWKELWVVQVACDSDLRDASCRVAVIIAKALDPGSRAGSPSQATISAVLSCSVDTVARAVREMELRGHLRTRRQGHGSRNRVQYEPILKSNPSPQSCGDKGWNHPRRDAEISQCRFTSHPNEQGPPPAKGDP